MQFLEMIWSALLLAAAMAWQVGWSLVLGFVLSGLVQAVVSKERMRAQLGRGGIAQIALATGYGAASSSCSYAAAALSRTLFKKGAALGPSLAFLFSSTNLVVELGIVLYVLIGWQFMVAEWLGGVVLIAIMALIVRLTYPRKLIEEARHHSEGNTAAHDHGDDDIVEGATIWERLRNPQTAVVVAQNVNMDWSMLWKDVVIGFLIAGAIATFVPADVWRALYFNGSPSYVQFIAGPLFGALIAIFTFVCSIGNVPMAAILWGTGISFGGALSFLYADLIVLPLLDVYRKYYGVRMAGYIFGVFFVTMVLAGMTLNALFAGLHLIPSARPDVRGMVETFSFNYTFWLNLIALGGVIYLARVNRQNPMDGGGHCEHHGHAAAASAAS